MEVSAAGICSWDIRTRHRRKSASGTSTITPDASKVPRRGTPHNNKPRRSQHSPQATEHAARSAPDSHVSHSSSPAVTQTPPVGDILCTRLCRHSPIALAKLTLEVTPGSGASPDARTPFRAHLSVSYFGELVS